MVAGMVAMGTVTEEAHGQDPKVANAVADECLVRVKVEQPECLHCLFEAKQLLSAATGSISLDFLTMRHRVVSIEPLFRREGPGPLSLRGMDVDRAIVEAIVTHPDRIERGIGVGRIHELPSFSQVYRLRFAEGINAREACQAFAEDAAVVYAHPNYLVYASETRERVVRADELADALQTSVGAAPGAVKPDVSEQPILVAIVDTGLANPSTPLDLDPRGWDMTTCEAYDATEHCVTRKLRDAEPVDGHGQGTRIAELIQRVLRRSSGHSSEQKPSIMILPVQVVNGQGKGELSDAVAGILYAVIQGADVVYLGFGTQQPIANATLLQEAVKLANDLGVLLVAPAGDEGVAIGGPEFGLAPASLDGVLTVTATDPKGQLLPTANWGPPVSLNAPGFPLLDPPSGTSEQRIRVPSGSSFAAAYVAAACALRFAVSPDVNLEALRSAIRVSADHEQDDLFDPRRGYGRLNLDQLLRHDDGISVRLLAPTHLATVGGWIDIFGWIRGPQGIPYRLSIGAGDDPSSWQTLVHVPTSLSETTGIVGDWWTTEVPDGLYTIRLELVDSDGTVAEDRRIVFVKNQPDALPCDTCGSTGELPVAPNAAPNIPP